MLCIFGKNKRSYAYMQLILFDLLQADKFFFLFAHWFEMLFAYLQMK